MTGVSGMSGAVGGWGLRRGASLGLACCFAPLLVILDRDDQEDQQGDTLDPRQKEEVIVQRAVIYIAYKKRRREKQNICLGEKEL